MMYVTVCKIIYYFNLSRVDAETFLINHYDKSKHNIHQN